MQHAVRFLLGAACFAHASCATPQPLTHARIAIHCSDGDAELTVDGVPHGLARDYANGHRLLLEPGAHVMVLRDHGMVETRSLMVGPEDDLTLTIALGTDARAASQGDLQ